MTFTEKVFAKVQALDLGEQPPTPTARRLLALSASIKSAHFYG